MLLNRSPLIAAAGYQHRWTSDCSLARWTDTRAVEWLVDHLDQLQRDGHPVTQHAYIRNNVTTTGCRGLRRVDLHFTNWNSSSANPAGSILNRTSIYSNIARRCRKGEELTFRTQFCRASVVFSAPTKSMAASTVPPNVSLTAVAMAPTAQNKSAHTSRAINLNSDLGSP